MSSQTTYLLLEKKGEDKDTKKEIVKDAKKMCVLATIGAPVFFVYSFYNKCKKMFL
jgi:hypothetical protein